jgi:hypothetical protein
MSEYCVQKDARGQKCFYTDHYLTGQVTFIVQMKNSRDLLQRLYHSVLK